ncbi:hypothetical protein PanWU01x14_206440 [Parasponia andersonii]|uniref:Uncharacterized protein n=1 Tax=Parasponia andersonii TaxID=3476 RepID=A0A2P5BVJ9_PARAD|nr:hypothetical protein PanWU01x14_206440 [Parasponia andersonii]
MRVNPVSFERRKPDPNLSNSRVTGSTNATAAAIRLLASAEVAVVEDSKRDNRAGIINLPCVLLIPFGIKGVENCSRSNPFMAILSHTIRIRTPLAILHLHGKKPLSA